MIARKKAKLLKLHLSGKLDVWENFISIREATRCMFVSHLVIFTFYG